MKRLRIIRTIRRPAVAAAEAIDGNKQLQAFARFGYVVNGLLHALIGIAAVGIVIGSGGEVDQTGVLKPLATTLWGLMIILLIALGLIGLSLWKIIQILVSTKLQRKGLKKYALEEGGKAAAYLGLGVSTIILVFGHASTNSSAEASRQLVATLFGIPLGPALILIIGVVCMVVGSNFIYKGVTRRFMRTLDATSDQTRPYIVVIGTVGYISKGVILGVLGILFFISVFVRDPSRASGLDGAFKTMMSFPFGAILITAIGIGFVFYGLFNITRAKIGYIRIKAHKYI